MKTAFTQDQINEVMEKRGGTRKAALRWLNRNATKQPKGKTAPTRDFKSAAANDKPDAKPEVKLPAKNASLVAKGAAYHVLAGRPSKNAAVACFGKSGYTLSWVSRAERLGVTPQELCESFRSKSTITPLCALEEAKERFEGKYLDSSNVKIRLTESAQIVTPEGETKFLFLKNVLPSGSVARTLRTLRKLRFSPAKHSRRRALKTSVGGELLFGWILFPSQEKNGGLVPTLTAATREQWPEFRNLWPMLWRIQHNFNQHLPEVANAQKAKAASAKESYLDYLFRVHFQEAGATYGPDRKTFRADLEQYERANPDGFEQWFWETFAHFNPQYFDRLIVGNFDGKIQTHMPESVVPSKKQGAAMMGYMVPGTMFSTITVNKSALFRCHADGNNLPGALACLSAFGNF